MEGVTRPHSHSSTPSSVFPIRSIGDGLTFSTVADDVASAVARPGSAAVVQAPPGTGKTTLVPPIVANATLDGRVIVTQPRRLAARASAQRLTELTAANAPQLARSIAYTVRGESTLTPHTRIEFVTPGVLLRRLLEDPELTGVGAVVIDEIHERALETDLLLALLLDIRALREDLTLLALSATLDAPRFASAIEAGTRTPTPIIDSPSALYPIEVRQEPFTGARVNERGVSRDFLSHVARVAVRALQEPGHLADADVLVFAPGAWEVEQIAREIRAAHPDAQVCELHGRLSLREQDAITRGRASRGQRRIVVSTNLAESSLTVPGVRIVVDTGLSREVRRDSARKMSGLVTVTSPRSSMTQREGRSGRLGPGLAIRCFDDLTFAGARAHASPEIASADLTDAALLLAAWGTPEGRGLTLLDPLPAGALSDALDTLRALGAITADGTVTPRGRIFASIPTDPRLARALLDAPHLLATRSTKNPGSSGNSGGDSASLISSIATVVAALSLEAPLPLQGTPIPGPRAPLALHKREARRLAALATAHRLSGTSGPDAVGLEEPRDPAHLAGIVTALAYPERIARRVEDGVYELAGGTRAGLPPGHAAAGEWIAVAEVTRSTARDAAGTGALIREAAPVSEAEALACGATLLSEKNEVVFTADGIKARRIKALGTIILSSTPTRARSTEAKQAVVAGVRAAGVGIFHWSQEARQLRARVALLHRELGEPWPDVSDDALAERLEEIAAPELDALAGDERHDPVVPGKIDAHEILRRVLPWPEAMRLDELAPERIRVPSGSHIRLDYPEEGSDGPVRLSVKLQEMFGLEEVPRIVDGNIAVQCELLSPARRPLALTDSLATFWDGPYAQVRAHMRGRYPKHPWPEDPRAMEATAKTRRALRNAEGKRRS